MQDWLVEMEIDELIERTDEHFDKVCETVYVDQLTNEVFDEGFNVYFVLEYMTNYSAITVLRECGYSALAYPC